MGSRWYSIAVIGLWLSSMTWLVVRKVLPPLVIGEPPSYATVVDTAGPQPPVGWDLAWDGRRLGWAVNTMRKQIDQTTEIRSHIHFEKLPLQRWLPLWLRPMLAAGSGRAAMEAESNMTIDPLGRLSEFDSALRLHPFQSLVRVRGWLDGNKLRLSIRVADFAADPEVSLPPGASLADSLAPQVRLPGLWVGQTWTVSSYSPMNFLSNPIGFLEGQNPLEVLQARVEKLVPFLWHGQREHVWLVVYSKDGGLNSWSSPAATICNQLWVRRDGTILRQEVMLGGSVLSFSRLADEDATALLESAELLSRGGRSLPAPRRTATPRTEHSHD